MHIFLLLVVLYSSSALGAPYRIYINADFTHNKESGESIYMGVDQAFKKVGYELNGLKFSVLKCDHRGVNSRSDLCVRKFIDDDKAFVMFAGLHSPPLIANIKKANPKYSINSNRVLTFVPWAAAGMITRAPNPNWIYRLSIDDKYAGQFIITELLREKERKIALFLVNDGWGQFNRRQMGKVLSRNNITPKLVRMFERDITLSQAKVHLKDIVDAGATSIILVANAPQGKLFFTAIDQMNLTKKIKVRSHWGITGGDLWNSVGSSLKKIDLKVIQSNFSFFNNKSSYAVEVFGDLKQSYEHIKSPADLKAPAGFIHAYDMSIVAQSCLRKIKTTGDLLTDRVALKDCLENIDWNVQGLVKEYNRPFSNIETDVDGHDALRIEDFKMFRYNENGELIPTK